MYKININNQIGCKTFIFPDNQPHINIYEDCEDDEVHVTCSITDSNQLLLLLGYEGAKNFKTFEHVCQKYSLHYVLPQ